jgi:hypothetical protein
MAKLGLFFRRLFNTNDFDDEKPPEPRKNVRIIPTVTTPKVTLMATQSCTVSPRISPRLVTKQTSVHSNQSNEIPNSNFLSSDIHKSNIRRLSAPLIIHTSANHPPQYPSTIVNESTEEALLSSLHRLSLSTSLKSTGHHNNSIHSLVTTSPGCDSTGSPISRPDVRSASFNLSSSPSTLSNHLVNNIFSTSGRWRNVLLFSRSHNFAY